MADKLSRSLTYAQLVSSIGASELHKGEILTISDFATRHFITDGLEAQALDELLPAEVTGTTEPLTVLATSANTIDIVAKSTLFPNDKIEYDWNPANWMDNINFVTGETPTLITGFKGVITYREDTIQNNSCGFDFRNCKNRLWSIDQEEWSDTPGTYSEGDFVKVTIGGEEASTIIYVALGAAISTDIPGESDVWRAIWYIHFSAYWSTNSTGMYLNQSLTIPVINELDFIDMLSFGENYEYVNNCHINSSKIGKVFLPSIIIQSIEAYHAVNILVDTSCSNIVVGFCEHIIINQYSRNLVVNNCSNAKIIGSYDFSLFSSFSFEILNCGYFSISDCSRFVIGENSGNFTITNSFSFNIGNACDNFSIGNTCSSFSLGNECCNLTIGNECSKFTINNFSGGEAAGLIIPDSSINFNLLDGTRIDADLTGQSTMSGTYNKTIMLNNAGELILVYFDSATGQTIVNLSNP